MKTKTQSFPKRLAAAFVFLLAASSVLTACPGKGGGDAAPISPYGVFSGCPTCGAIGGVLVPNATSTGQDPYFPVTMSWQILGDQNMMAQMQAYLPATTPYGNYRGPVVVRGGITLATQVIGSGMGGYGGYGYGQPYPVGQQYGGAIIPGQTYGVGQCVIPAGSYTFDTTMPGMMNQGTFQVQEVEAIGPVRFRFLVRGILSRPYGAALDQIYAGISVTSINGVSCGRMSTTVY